MKKKIIIKCKFEFEADEDKRVPITTHLLDHIFDEMVVLQDSGELNNPHIYEGHHSINNI
jgi:hypothetical protein